MFDNFETIISLRGCLGDADSIHHPDLDEVKGWLEEARAVLPFDYGQGAVIERAGFFGVR